MIYFYQSISPQPIENLHACLHHFYTQLLVPVPPAYTRAIFIHANFVAAATANKNNLESKLITIHLVYSALTPAEKLVVQSAYANNNNILGICNRTVDPIKYSQLPNAIQQPVRSLYDSIWTMLSHKDAYVEIKNLCGTLKTHFETFRQTNLKSVCPFCGMGSLLHAEDKMKNAYDHYIPKSEYPFCSVNFQNLFPICDTCNKNGNKGFKDIPYFPAPNNTVREVLYFPYNNATEGHKIKLKISSSSFNLSNKNSWTLDIDCDPTANRSRKDRWIEIYNIEDRYKSKIASDSYSWMDDILKEFKTKSKRAHFVMADFKSDILNRYEDVFMKNNWIIEKCFHEFYLNDPNFDSSITSTI